MLSAQLLHSATVVTHVFSITFWFGGLFAYVLLVWPAVFADAGASFPRALLCRIAMRTGPLIYLAMAGAMASGLLLAMTGAPLFTKTGYFMYLGLLSLPMLNNVYGSVASWPAIMMRPERTARRAWRAFHLRMTASLVLGIALIALFIASLTLASPLL